MATPPSTKLLGTFAINVMKTLKKIGLLALLTTALIAGPMPEIKSSKVVYCSEQILSTEPAHYYSPWENTIRKVKNIDKNLREETKQKLQKKWGVRPRSYFGYMDDEREKDLIKWVYESAEVAGQNKHKIKVTPSEIFVMFMLEGGAHKYGLLSENNSSGYYTKYRNNHRISGSEDLGLDFINSEIATLKKSGFVPYSVKIEDYSSRELKLQPLNEQGVRIQTAYFSNLEDGLKVLAGTFAERKYAFLQDFKKHFGGDELNRLSEEETFFWTAFYFNAGKNCGKGELTGTPYINGRGLKQHGQGREKVYKPLEHAEPSTNCNPKVNALIKLATKQWIDNFGLFKYSQQSNMEKYLKK